MDPSITPSAANMRQPLLLSLQTTTSLLLLLVLLALPTGTLANLTTTPQTNTTLRHHHGPTPFTSLSRRHEPCPIHPSEPWNPSCPPSEQHIPCPDPSCPTHHHCPDPSCPPSNPYHCDPDPCPHPCPDDGSYHPPYPGDEPHHRYPEPAPEPPYRPLPEPHYPDPPHHPEDPPPPHHHPDDHHPGFIHPSTHCPAESEGLYNCMRTTWQRCASGRWSERVRTAAGTVCAPEGLVWSMRTVREGEHGSEGAGGAGGGEIWGPVGPGVVRATGARERGVLGMGEGRVGWEVVGGLVGVVAGTVVVARGLF
ncbi:hypothetical protein QBC39DRAFT_407309 [Podospora conica]|nr:hypothetical protein QBC39DRAFT_407309 [Schizothecium conicum]